MSDSNYGQRAKSLRKAISPGPRKHFVNNVKKYPHDTFVHLVECNIFRNYDKKTLEVVCDCLHSPLRRKLGDPKLEELHRSEIIVDWQNALTSIVSCDEKVRAC